jgi:2-dehydro-3-deoxygalactonokinase
MDTDPAVVVIDSGTTNSRLSVVRGVAVLAHATAAVGVVDTAKTGSNATLKRGVREAFDHALREAGLAPGEVSHALAFGMITSELGVVELPHLLAPAGLRDLAGSLHCLEPADDFLPIPTHFIRGIKNRAESFARVRYLPQMDFMRGEETQVMGLLALERPALPMTVVVLSSHTKFISVDEAGQIQGSVTTLSGQLYAALCKETFLASTIQEAPGDPEPPGYFEPGLVEEAWRIVSAAGLTRALLLPRFMQVLMGTRWYERRLFLEALIASEDLHGLADFVALRFPTTTSVYLVGPPARCAVLAFLIERSRAFRGAVTSLSDPEAIERLGPAGALEIFRYRLG